MSEFPWRAVIYRHAGQPDTVCIKNAQGGEIVSWSGFDGVPGTKKQIRERAKMIVNAVNAMAVIHNR